MPEKTKESKGTCAPTSIDTCFHLLLPTEPEVIIRHMQSAQSSTTAPLDHVGPKHQQSLGGQAQTLWQKLKDEDKERKETRIQHVSHADAAKITGHGEDDPNSNVRANEGNGGKRSIGALFFG
jgi:hypothetical protein